MRKKLTITLALAAVGCICWLGCSPNESVKLKDQDAIAKLNDLENRVAILESQSENNGHLAARGLALTLQSISAMHRGLLGKTNGPQNYWPVKSNGFWTVVEQ